MADIAEPQELIFTGADGNCLVADSWGAGTPVLLLHGGGQTRHSWNRTAAQLAAAGRRAITVDMRGHGDSDWSADRRYSMRTHSHDVSAICHALDEPPALVGASMGGAAAMIAAGERPDGGTGLARCLVLVDVTPRMEVVGVSRIREFMMSAPDGFASLDDAADAIAHYRNGGPRRSSTQGLGKNLRLGEDGRYRWHWDPHILDDMPAQGTGPAELYQMLAAAAAGVRVPTLLVRGGNSDVVSLEGASELKDLIPHAEIAEISRAGHMVAGDANDHFAGAILDFASRH